MKAHVLQIATPGANFWMCAHPSIATVSVASYTFPFSSRNIRRTQQFQQDSAHDTTVVLSAIGGGMFAYAHLVNHRRCCAAHECEGLNGHID